MFETESVSKTPFNSVVINRDCTYNLRQTPLRKRKRAKLQSTVKRKKVKRKTTGDGMTVRLIQVFRGKQHSLKLRFYSEVTKKIHTKVLAHPHKHVHAHTYIRAHIHSLTHTNTCTYTPGRKMFKTVLESKHTHTRSLTHSLTHSHKVKVCRVEIFFIIPFDQTFEKVTEKSNIRSLDDFGWNYTIYVLRYKRST